MLAFLDSLKATLMTEKLHWLPLSARIQFKIIFQDYKVCLGLAPSYRCKLIMRPLSTISDRPLRSLDRNDLLAPQARTRVHLAAACFCISWTSVMELSPCKNPCSNSLRLVFLYSSSGAL